MAAAKLPGRASLKDNACGFRVTLMYLQPIGRMTRIAWVAQTVRPDPVEQPTKTTSDNREGLVPALVGC